MARLLAYQSPAQGQVYPTVAMLLELARRGHEVHVRTLSSEATRLRALGLHAHAVDPRIEAIEIDDWRARSQIDSLRKLVRAFAARAKLERGDLRRAIDDLQPDALIVDNGCEGAMYVAEASALPWAMYCPYPPPFRSVDAPTHGFGFRRARGPLGRLRDRLAWRLGDHLLAPELRPLNDMRAELGLAPLRTFDEQWLKADRFIAFTAEPYEYHRSDWPTGVRLVGPGLWEPPAEPPAWLEAETRPIVLVTASTAYQRDDKLIATALAALAAEDMAVVATTAALDPKNFRPPANARVERFVPHGIILARATCVVCHGGQGITQKALAAGVPPCVVPFSRDQFDVARRVQAVDAGVRLHHRRLHPRRLRDAVRATITKRSGAERVARSFAAAGGAGAAADAVEELVPATTEGAADTSPAGAQQAAQSA